MTIILNEHTDPYFNLASEEYLIDHAGGEVMMLWRNAPSVIIGKNQNAYAEINEPFVRSKGIKVVRRLTGGGAVFHDLGNVNYTCIVPRESGQTLDFARFAMPVIGALRALGVPAEFSGRNDITIEGKKVSGNAQCVRGGKMMHHGTLLFRSDMTDLAGALNVDPDKIKAKGIKSVRARVGNIGDYLPDYDVLSFKHYLEEFFEGEKRGFTEEEEKEIALLTEKKYSTWEWNFGESKELSVRKKKYFPFGLVDFRLSADGGVIRECDISGDFFGVSDVNELASRLIGVRLESEALKAAIDDPSDYIWGATASDLAELILS
ncbi:MAG: lipoate--protein ligase [Lachnospiraceae bacterium]|nr:lipoate--protein ligase [Lachnospiraceae bacterium]